MPDDEPEDAPFELGRRRTPLEAIRQEKKAHVEMNLRHEAMKAAEAEYWNRLFRDHEDVPLPHDDVRERLADVSHDIWSHWTRWQFGTCTRNEDGSLTIPAALVERWTRQMNTPYAELTEREKDSDREQADKILAVLSQVKEQ